MPSYVTQSDVEAAIGVTAVRELCDDDGDGVADSSIVATMILRGSAVARGLLMPGFQGDTAIANIATDDEVKDAIACVVARCMGRRKPEFLSSEGKGRFDTIGNDAEKVLEMMGKAHQRVGAENTYGKNATLGGSTNTTTPVIHTFAASRTNVSGSGGF